MSVKFLKIRVDRFEAGKVLAKPIYLNMPYNRKMICVASKGDYLRPNLLKRLPPYGVAELYAYAPDGENRNPDTYPIHLDELMAEKGQNKTKTNLSISLEKLQEEGMVRKIHGALEIAEGMAFGEVHEDGDESRIIIEEHTVKDTHNGQLIDARDPERQAVLGKVLAEAGPAVLAKPAEGQLLHMEPTQEEKTYSKIIANVTEDIQEECSKVMEVPKEVACANVLQASAEKKEESTSARASAPEPEAKTRISSSTEMIDDGLVTVSGREPEADQTEKRFSGGTDVVNEGEMRVKHLEPRKGTERKLKLIQGGAPQASDPAANAKKESLRELENVREQEKQKAATIKGEMRHAESLGSILVSVVKQFAKTGERYRSTELKFLAGAMGETARVFFNSSMRLDSSSVDNALDELESAWQELNQLSQGENKQRFEALNMALADAICVFRRESKNPDPTAAAVSVAQAA